jgi:RNA polymerase sigma-70 factor (ECF subfamily)
MEAMEPTADTPEVAKGRMSDDRDLLVAAIAMPAEFAEVYRTYRQPVYRYLRSLVASDDEASDLTATTFERALRSLGSYRASGSAVGWLLRIARNAAIDAARRRRPSVSWDDPSARRLAADDPPLEEELETGERLRELQRLVRELPSATRDAISLRYGAGLSAREIGAVLNKSEAATQKLITRGLAALKEAHRAQG